MIRTSLFLLAVLATTARADDKKVMASLEGEWIVTKHVENGVEKNAEKLKKESSRYVFKGDKVTFHRDGKNRGDAAVTLDTKNEIIRIGIKPEKEPKDLGILKIDGDTLTLCMSMDNKTYPEKFESTKTSKTELIELKKVVKK